MFYDAMFSVLGSVVVFVFSARLSSIFRDAEVNASECELGSWRTCRGVAVSDPAIHDVSFEMCVL